MTRRPFPLVLSLSIVVLACGPSPSLPPAKHVQARAESDSLLPERKLSVEIRTLRDFEDSQFCGTYACKENRTWPLKTGGVNHDYSLDFEDVLMEVSTKGQLVTGLGLVFTNRSDLSTSGDVVGHLSNSDFVAIRSLVMSLKTSISHDQSMYFIQRNIEKNVSKVRHGASVRDGRFRIFVGNVAGDQTIAIERISN